MKNNMTIIRLHGGDLGAEQMIIGCELNQASAPVLVDYLADTGEGFRPTQYQCADACHRPDGLAAIGMALAARALEVPVEGFCCEWEVE